MVEMIDVTRHHIDSILHRYARLQFREFIPYMTTMQSYCVAFFLCANNVIILVRFFSFFLAYLYFPFLGIWQIVFLRFFLSRACVADAFRGPAGGSAARGLCEG